MAVEGFPHERCDLLRSSASNGRLAGPTPWLAAVTVVAAVYLVTRPLVPAAQDLFASTAGRTTTVGALPQSVRAGGLPLPPPVALATPGRQPREAAAPLYSTERLEAGPTGRWAPLVGVVAGLLLAMVAQSVRQRRGPVPATFRDVALAPAGFAMAATAGDAGAEAPPMLEVRDLQAVVASTGQQILKGFNLTIREGEVHAIMGKNGSGKSTFTKVLVGHPGYEVTGGSVRFRGRDLLTMEPEERSHAGLFLSFQAPIEIPGVSNTDFLRLSYNAKRKARGEPEKDPLEFYGYLMPKLQQLKMDPSFLTRNVNEGFSGGEKKRNEILQLAVLEADLALLDEIDSGLDVDALRDVAAAVNGLRRPGAGLLMITHYKRLLDLIEPDFIHIVSDGRVVQSGDKSLSSILEEEGFTAFARS